MGCSDRPPRTRSALGGNFLPPRTLPPAEYDQGECTIGRALCRENGSAGLQLTLTDAELDHCVSVQNIDGTASINESLGELA